MRRSKLLPLGLLVAAIAGTAYAGLKNTLANQFPPNDQQYKTAIGLIEGAQTASIEKAIQFYTLTDEFYDRFSYVTRVMAGTITQYTVMLYANDQALLRTAIDCYGGALTHAGTIDQGVFVKDIPLLIPAGTKITVSMFLAGSNSPTVTDGTWGLVSRSKAGLE